MVNPTYKNILADLSAFLFLVFSLEDFRHALFAIKPSPKFWVKLEHGR